MWNEYAKEYSVKLRDFIKKTNKDLFDNHHLVPVSLHWHDKEYNRVFLRRPMHDHIHSVLNIPKKRYHQIKRKYREKTNHLIIKSPEMVKEIHEMQSYYFKNYYKLLEVEKTIHNTKMRQTVKHWESVADDFIEYDSMNYMWHFQDMLIHKNMIHLRISQEIKDTLSKKFYHNK